MDVGDLVTQAAANLSEGVDFDSRLVGEVDSEESRSSNWNNM